MAAWNWMAGDADISPSTTSRSNDTLQTPSGMVSSKYSNGVTQKASSPATRALTCPPTWLSHPCRNRIRRDAAMRNRMSFTSTVAPPGWSPGAPAVGSRGERCSGPGRESGPGEGRRPGSGVASGAGLGPGSGGTTRPTLVGGPLQQRHQHPLLRTDPVGVELLGVEVALGQLRRTETVALL